MKNLFENIQINAKMECVISGMEILLNKSKISQPERDFASQMELIKDLRQFQFEFLETVEENRILNKMYNKVFSQNSQYEIALDDLNKKNELLKIEVENLKQNLPI